MSSLDHHLQLVEAAKDPTTPPDVVAKIRAMPVAPSPDGSPPEFIDPESRGPAFIIVGSVMIALMTLLVGARVYAKFVVIRKVTWDDLTCSLAATGAYIYFAIAILYVNLGAGRHLWDTPLLTFWGDRFQWYGYTLNVIVPPILFCAQISLFILYIQIFHSNKPIRWAIYFGAGLSAAFYLGATIAHFYYITPRSHSSFNIQVFEHVNATRSLSYSLPSAGIILDLYLLAIPAAGVMALHLSTRRKVGLIVIFSSSLLASICSAISLHFRVEGRNSNDEAWLVMRNILLQFVEMTMLIIWSCVPGTVAVVRHHFPSPKTRMSNYSQTLDSFTAGTTRSGKGKARGVVYPPPEYAAASADVSGVRRERSTSDSEWGRDVELGQVKSVKSFIRAGSERVEGDGIWTSREMQQTWQYEMPGQAR